jgi:hypothetical protein
MAVSDSVDPAGWFAEQIGACEPDLLRQMVKTMAEALMSAEADAICGAGYGERSDGRTNRRNGYRERDWDTRAGTVELAIPRLRSGSYFPEWLLERRRRAEQIAANVRRPAPTSVDRPSSGRLLFLVSGRSPVRSRPEALVPPGGHSEIVSPISRPTATGKVLWRTIGALVLGACG